MVQQCSQRPAHLLWLRNPAGANIWQHGQTPQAVRMQAPFDVGVGAQGAAHDATAEAAQAAGSVVRVQSRPPAMGAKFETPRRTVKPFSELEVETLVDVRRAHSVYCRA